ncbi:MAG: ABC transporter permease [Bacteroidales bacterium]
MKKFFEQLRIGFLDTCFIWREEYTHVFRDYGVILFFFALPLVYPIVYALIYNTELVRNTPMVVVDDCRTPLSRKLARDMDASPNAKIISYCANIDEAKDMMHSRECYGILFIPKDFSRKVMRGEQSPVIFYADMSMMLNYKGFLITITDVTTKIGGELQSMALGGESNRQKEVTMNPIPSSSITLYNPEGGYGSFLIPAVLVLILQQSIILGIGMLAGGIYEKRRLRFYYSEGRNPSNSILHIILGKSICYYSLYILSTIYILRIVPWMFSFPQIAPQWEIYTFMAPYLFSSILFAMTLSVFCRERETTFIIFVFTSLLFLFISGITWPMYAMPPAFRFIGWFIPSTWGVDGYIHLNTMGSTIKDVWNDYLCLWGLTGFYLLTTYLTYFYQFKKDKERGLRGKMQSAAAEEEEEEEINKSTGN